MSQYLSQNPARTATADSYGRYYTFSATIIEMADYQMLTISKRDNKAKTTTHHLSTLATKEALYEAVAAGHLNFNTPAFICASHALQGKFGSCY